MQSLAWASANWPVQIINHSDAEFVWAAHMLNGGRDCLHGRKCDRNQLGIFRCICSSTTYGIVVLHLLIPVMSVQLVCPLI
jgi:hypothetical protein